MGESATSSESVRSGEWGTTFGSRGRVLAFIGTLVALIAVAVLVGSIGGWVGRPPTPAVQVSVPTQVRPSRSVVVRSTPSTTLPPERSDNFAPWFWLLLAGVVAILVYLLLRRAWDARRRILERKRRAGEPDPGVGAQLDDEPPPPVVQLPQGRQFDARAAADAIVSCWVWVEQWAAARGRPRLSFETPTEFLDRVVLGASGAAREAGGTVDPNADPSVGSAAAQQDPATGASHESNPGTAADEAARMAAARILLPLYQRARFDVEALDPESAVRARDAALTVCGRDPVDAR